MKWVHMASVAIIAIVAISSGSVTTNAETSSNVRNIYFTENLGQWDEKVRFRASVKGVTLWLTTDGVYHQFTRGVSPDFFSNGVRTSSSTVSFDQLSRPGSVEHLIVKSTFVGANVNAAVVGEYKTVYKCNYFLGNDPAKWRTNVPNYESIVTKNVYPGIDVRYYGAQGHPEYDLIVSPGADPNQIAIQYDGVKSLTIDGCGELVVNTEWGELRECIPAVYQRINGERIEISADYELRDNTTIRFELSKDNDTSHPMTIDPVLEYSTYLGGSAAEEAWSIEVDDSGCIYVAGHTHSVDFPTFDAFQGTSGGGYWDIFITKLASSGDSLVYSTYLGGSSGEYQSGMTIDETGALYITGATISIDFPLVNPYQESLTGDADAFISKLSPNGDALVFSTYFGGSDIDEGIDIAVDAFGLVYVTGRTESDDFPILNAFQETSAGYQDSYVAKLDESGSELLYSTYVGGSDWDGANCMSVDESCAVYVVGYTFSTDFPVVNALQNEFGGGTHDAFILKVSSDASELVYSTYLGGTDYETAVGVALDDSGSLFVIGTLGSRDFPTVSPYQDAHGGGLNDIFVSRLSSSGQELLYSTYLGASSDDVGCGIALDELRNICLTGYSYSPEFPIFNSIQEHGGFADAIVTKLSSNGSSLIYSTFIGGSDRDYSYDLVLNDSGNVYITGYTKSTDFPTLDPYQTSQGDEDVFIARMSSDNYLCGDMDHSGDVSADDVVSLLNYIFSCADAPNPLPIGNADCSGNIDIDDIVYLIKYLFSDGHPPCDTDGDGVPDC